MLSSCQSHSSLEQEMLTGRQWIRELNNKSYDGFYLSADRRLLLINAPARIGDQWLFKHDKLMMWEHTELNPSPREYGYYFELDEQKLILRPDDGANKRFYVDNRLSVPLENIRWVPSYIYNPDNVTIPILKNIYLRFEKENNQLKGFGGVSYFAGKYEIQAPIGINVTDLPEPEANPPADAFQPYFLDLLYSSNTYLVVRESLFLYRGTRLLAAFDAAYY